MALLPWLVQALLRQLQPLAAGHALALLALERARRMPASAAVAVGGVVAALSLAVALTVMVGSFRGSVSQWLDSVLPAPLYLRAAGGARATRPPYFPRISSMPWPACPRVARVQALRTSSLQLAPDRAPWRCWPGRWRAIRPGPATGGPCGPRYHQGRVGVYVSEAVRGPVRRQAQARTGRLLSEVFRPLAQSGQAPTATFSVAGVWRDYVRQHGAIALDLQDFVRLTGDARASDLALWPAPGARPVPCAARCCKQARQSPGRRGGRRTGIHLGRCDTRTVAWQCSTAASPSPTGCRRWPSASGCSAWPPASARRCWRGARSSGCWPTWG